MGFNITPMVKNLLFLNIGIFLLAHILGFAHVYDFMALRYFGSPDFKVHQIFTHMFMHSDFFHLLFNMFGLFMFGSTLESVWGPKRFLIFYLICGLGASLIYTGVNAFEYYQIREAIEAYISNPDPNQFEVIIYKKFPRFAEVPQFAQYYNQFPRTFAASPNNASLIKESIDVLNYFYEIKISSPMVGASGALFGVLLGFGMLFPNTPIMLMFIPIPIKAKYFVIAYGLIELYNGFKMNPFDSVAHFAHLGGMIFGFILIKYWQRQRGSFY